MQLFILNFKRTGVSNIIETLGLTSLIKTLQDSHQIPTLDTNTAIKEHSIPNFFSEELYNILKEVEFINSNHHSLVGGGGH
ncbi:hypothetical protein [Helicobacter apodemus]|uniref:Uncharacterized protein n=1 Tax=Helicobacter apodemus TaxID=135569 RepID=A0A2U8FFH4_9HELI|nr:hypothetical protein [Helicobacter apodemus]AWI35041.1 hypothetical protein CDV25_01275 [Helicobacter apodemus]